ncbi:glycosyltransferase family 2 protein [Butyrivibrio sp. AE2032]|uniref:glycosyltransferase family 2 protein n=1 Tax=Butyrivibrio sp. AE2032 TaxID=1458463 RepID=UPI00068BA21F|nr:glycosyltransferase family 2 protein [Butyrivibrio sp. AE2032]
MLSIVVPAYNEGEHIYDNLMTIDKALSAFASDYEIIAVNDGSRDNTGAEVKRAAADNPNIKDFGYDKNRGKGGAVSWGAINSKGDIVGFIDADLDLSPNLISGYYKEMIATGSDVVIGSKMHKDSKLEYPPARKLFSFCYFVMLKVLFGLKCHDTQTGLKLYKGSLIREIAPLRRIDGYAFDIELLALASRKKAKLTEMPVELNYTRNQSFGRIKFRDVWKMFTDTWKIWWNLRVRKNYFK